MRSFIYLEGIQGQVFSLSLTRVEELLRSQQLPNDVTTNIMRALQDDGGGMVFGTVAWITTEKGKKSKAIRPADPQTDFVVFNFPPNTEEFEKEFERAQNYGLQIQVIYHQDADKNKVIDQVKVGEKK